MKKNVLTFLLVGLFALAPASLLWAQAGHEEHHPQAAEQPGPQMGPGGMMGMGGMPCGMMGGSGTPGMPGMGMMGGGMGMGRMGGMMCPMCGMMMGGGMPAMTQGMEGMPGMGMGMGRMMGGMRPMGMMGRMGMMDGPFFLDRVQELGLSDEQLRKLQEIRRAARGENIRTDAELKIARMELQDLMAGEWSVEAAEKQIRNIQKMQGDMKVRFLKAKKEAEKVLTPEQLKKARGGEEDLGELFQ